MHVSERVATQCGKGSTAYDNIMSFSLTFATSGEFYLEIL